MAPAPRYLGLDLGNCTGYCLVEGNKIIKSGVRDFSVKSSQHIGHRGIKFYNFLHSIGQVDEVYYEKIQFTGARKGGGNWSGDNGELYKGLLMLVNMFCAGYGIPNFGVFPITLKKDFCGHGGAEKADMCAVARSMGWRGGQANTAMFHDEVDAIALLVTQLRQKYNIKVTF